MPPRKRKAPASRSGPQCLQAIAEEGQEGVPSAGAAVPEARDSRGRTKEEAINHIADEVFERFKDLQSTGRELACAVRWESQIACSRLPKKVQTMSVAEFFSLSPDEAKQTALTDLISRLSMLLPGSKAGQNESLSAAPPSTQPPIPSTAAPTTRTTRRTAARTGHQQQEQQHCAPPPATTTRQRATRTVTQAAVTATASAAAKDQAHPSASESAAPSTETDSTTLPSAQQQQQQQQQEQAQQAVAVSNNGVTAEHVLRDCTNLNPAAEAGRAGQMLPPKRGGRPGGKQAAPRSEHKDAEAVQQAPVAATPAHQGHDLVAATPVGTGINTARAQPGTSALSTNFTLVKRTAARGRTGRRAGDESAIMISTSDGRQFMVDAGTGVANIPDKYRNEVSAQLEVLHRLAGAALNI